PSSRLTLPPSLTRRPHHLTDSQHPPRSPILKTIDLLPHFPLSFHPTQPRLPSFQFFLFTTLPNSSFFSAPRANQKNRTVGP
ncbi:MAG: hypothetical protein NTX04_01025, partial [Verrucomicrobia bacterium]|nr:hypothetical protein [Verrucomicrobiota bacterium]